MKILKGWWSLVKVVTNSSEIEYLLSEVKSFIRQESLDDDEWRGFVASNLAELQLLACCQFALQNKSKEPIPVEALIKKSRMH